MNGKENIINKILSDADERCAEIVADAKTQAQQTVQAAQQAVREERQLLDSRIQAASDERMRNAIANAELDAKKYRLQVRQQLVGRCYDVARQRLAAMDEQQRLDFVGELLSRFAEDGETVYVTKADAQNVTQLWLDGFDKHLRLGKRYIRADGGVLLEGDGYEKDLTLANVVRYLKEQTEAQVAARLGVRNE